MKNLLFILFTFIIFSPWVVKADECLGKIDKCQKIPKYKIQTNLFLNPPGYQTYYERSKCFLDLAVAQRRDELCAHVKEHRALFLDGSKYSPKSCRQKVQNKIAEDKKNAERYAGSHQIKEAYFKLDGNERDFDFIIEATGNVSRPYKLILEVYDDKENLGTLYSNGYTFIAPSDRRYLYIQRQNLLDILKDRPIDKIYQVKISLVLNLDRFTIIYVPVEDKLIVKNINTNFSKLTWESLSYRK
ncbi:MAG: hypothetical protein ACD_20C00065G0001 [uncultured bacterium]|nr:MAG: hypothetical protein ACD_20C00065G0001 [uncultured bacterium]